MLTFKCFHKKILKTFPIKKVELLDFSWAKKMMEHLKTHTNWPAHTARCPGISGMLTTGWIQRSYQDFEIETNGDGSSFTWWSEVDQKKINKLLGDYIGFHDAGQLSRFTILPKETLHTHVKINSPWYVNIPKGYVLLVLPIPYPGHNLFSAAYGILKDNSVLNVPMMWHQLNGKVFVKKGTPLCQYLLLKTESIEISNQLITKKDIGLIRESKKAIIKKQLTQRVAKDKTMKKLYKKHLKGEYKRVSTTD